jgi:hypothetical protein
MLAESGPSWRRSGGTDHSRGESASCVVIEIDDRHTTPQGSYRVDQRSDQEFTPFVLNAAIPALFKTRDLMVLYSCITTKLVAHPLRTLLVMPM